MAVIICSVYSSYSMFLSNLCFIKGGGINTPQTKITYER